MAKNNSPPFLKILIVPVTPPNANCIHNNPPIIATQPAGDKSNSSNIVFTNFNNERNKANGPSAPKSASDAMVFPKFCFPNSDAFSPMSTQPCTTVSVAIHQFPSCLAVLSAFCCVSTA